MKSCPRCTSTAPHLHPAMQSGGEVELCTDDFHLTKTPQNTQAYIDAVLAKRARRAIEIDAANREAYHGDIDGDFGYL